MGYEVDFDISKNSPEIRQAIIKESGYDQSEFTADGLLKDATWYDCEEHLEIVSRLFPEQLIQVTINDPHEHTSYRQYFYNGEEETVQAVLTFPETTFKYIT